MNHSPAGERERGEREGGGGGGGERGRGRARREGGGDNTSTRVMDYEPCSDYGYCVCTSGESLDHGDEVFLHVLRGVGLRHCPQRLHRLVPHHCLLNCGQALQRGLG